LQKLNPLLFRFLVANAIKKKIETIPNVDKVLKQFCKLLKIETNEKNINFYFMH